jgi:rhamnosyltransferase
MGKLIAVIVSWNPEVETMRKTLHALHEQRADGAIISDNDSRPEIKEGLKILGEEFPGFVSFSWNNANLGMGGGLNRGVEKALADGAAWIITLEGDNTPEPGMIKTMFDAYDALPEEQKKIVATISPNYTGVRGMAFPDAPAHLTKDGAITSGEIVKADVYKKVGLYNEELFIDYVDGEFCWRIARNGMKTLRVPRAILKHRLGHPVRRRFLWKIAVIPNYPPYRYYYMARNSVYLFIRNFRTNILDNNHWYDFVWAFIIPRYIIKAILFEDQKWKKVRMVFRGLGDGFRGKMGILKNN